MITAPPNTLTAAGVDVDFVRLEGRGIHGNGHVVMLEKNSEEIASPIGQWLGTAVVAG